MLTRPKKPQIKIYTLVKRSWSHKLISGEYDWCSRISHCQQRKKSVTAAVWLIALSWRMMGFCTTKCRRFLLSPCSYDLFAKVKEPLRRQYKRNITRAYSVRRLSNIWQKMVNKGATILKIHKCYSPVNKAMSEILNFCRYFLSYRCV